MKAVVQWMVTILGLVLAVLWLVLVAVTHEPVPGWVPPAAVVLLAVALAMP